MAIGENRYKNSANLEPIAQAITSMGQEASKKDKPVVLGEKIKKISTDATGVEGEMLAGKTFYADGNRKTGSMANRGAWTNRLGVNSKIVIPAGYHNGQGYIDQSIATKGAQTYTPGTTNQTIAAGQYISGTQTIAGDPNLVPANIVKGKTIFGIAGSYISLPPLFIIQNGQWQNSFGSVMAIPQYPIHVFDKVQSVNGYMEFFTESTGSSSLLSINALSKPIDVSNYNKMIIKLSAGAIPAGIDNFELLLVPIEKIAEVKLQGNTESLYSSNYCPVFSRFTSSSGADNKLIEWNLSALTGNYYLILYADLANYYYDLYIRISNIYLSADPII